ncbi:hypothetical protein F4560_000811 [Saccharothrix ecbatanensis]|jgi:hypothetical protein|uniref:Excreted virulence factor EspC (Type VII ESX diderm) n=1 Tax=Saccharothrix ecbatanensis TaxID=1105145 RepID=A0A7W9LYU6_9PSEU|nr:hypothetical protein [Saccharothrix ecbatanensis]MBB5801043.1 hypothetical protein [Saccharothrix ecbatanensis]
MTGDGFSVEVDELRRVATDKLPMAITDLEVAGGYVGDTLSMSANAFASGSDVTDVLNGVTTAWTEVFAQVFRDIKDNRDNLDLARQAVLEIVERYRYADGQV